MPISLVLASSSDDTTAANGRVIEHLPLLTNAIGHEFLRTLGSPAASRSDDAPAPAREVSPGVGLASARPRA
ncbi:hypothetical protein MPC4_280006 [Methylocella tundrae]|uniref:Uncharacterized protein n=1 Tax=Methylocella tundrae TaxID=227605 RepID=A0A8B6M765_METTU|nr:hypothetical protein MPC1_680009 [Methylocella tundrae]VTZ50710.1 hypothetical protein MPC4_280006 [Methylocella tundrae]